MKTAKRAGDHLTWPLASARRFFFNGTIDCLGPSAEVVSEGSNATSSIRPQPSTSMPVVAKCSFVPSPAPVLDLIPPQTTAKYPASASQWVSSARPSSPERLLSDPFASTANKSTAPIVAPAYTIPASSSLKRGAPGAPQSDGFKRPRLDGNADSNSPTVPATTTAAIDSSRRVLIPPTNLQTFHRSTAGPLANVAGAMDVPPLRPLGTLSHPSDMGLATEPTPPCEPPAPSASAFSAPYNSPHTTSGGFASEPHSVHVVRPPSAGVQPQTPGLIPPGSSLLPPSGTALGLQEMLSRDPSALEALYHLLTRISPASGNSQAPPS
jgi:hypothetical protein